MPIILVLNDMGGAVINWSKGEVSPTIRAQDHGHPPVVVIEDDSDAEKILKRNCDRNRDMPNH